MATQRIIQKDGTIKIIHHEKKMNGVQFGSHTEWWRSLNKTASPDSKRQQLLNDSRKRDRENSMVTIPERP